MNTAIFTRSLSSVELFLNYQDKKKRAFQHVSFLHFLDTFLQLNLLNIFFGYVGASPPHPHEERAPRPTHDSPSAGRTMSIVRQVASL